LSGTGVRDTIGLVGGLGVGATIHYYQRLAGAVADHAPAAKLLISHASVEHVLTLVGQNALDALADYLADHIHMLSSAGAGFAAVTAVAPHICAAQLKRRIGLPFVDLIDCVRAELAARNVRRLAILGTRFVMESDLFGRLQDFQIVRPDAASIDVVHANYIQLATAGSTAGVDVEGLRRIAQNLVTRQGADIVVLAGTELSLAFDEADCGFRALDCARAHIDAIVRRMRGEPV